MPVVKKETYTHIYKYWAVSRAFLGIPSFERVIDFFPYNHHGWLRGRTCRVVKTSDPLKINSGGIK